MNTLEVPGQLYLEKSENFPTECNPGLSKTIGKTDTGVIGVLHTFFEEIFMTKALEKDAPGCHMDSLELLLAPDQYSFYSFCCFQICH